MLPCRNHKQTLLRGKNRFRDHIFDPRDPLPAERTDFGPGIRCFVPNANFFRFKTRFVSHSGRDIAFSEFISTLWRTYQNEMGAVYGCAPRLLLLGHGGVS